MDFIFKIAELFNGRNANYLKMALSLLFAANITYFIYCHFYGTSLDVKIDSQVSWINYFLRGEYLVPAGIFALTWYGTGFIGSWIFKLSNYFIANRVKAWIFKKSFLKEMGLGIDSNPQHELLASANGAPALADVYKSIRESLGQKQRAALSKSTAKASEAQAENFVLLFRALAAIVIAYIEVSYFGAGLFALLLVFLLAFSFTLFLAYQGALAAMLINIKLGQEVEERDKVKAPATVEAN
jgi:hypothetical protein